MSETKFIKKKPAHYVDGKDFYAAMYAYKKSVNKAKRNKEDKPRLPDYIGECFVKIANGLSHRPNFINYPFVEDMVGDGIENCLNYVDNFNPIKYKNPFAYFTQICFFAFLRRIAKEKKQLIIKYKAIKQSPFFLDLVQQAGDDRSYDNNFVKFLDRKTGDMVQEFEEKKQAKKKKKLNNLEKLIASDDTIKPVKETHAKRAIRRNSQK